MNIIYPGEKAIRIGRYKVYLCEKEGCNEPLQTKERKYCHIHKSVKRLSGLPSSQKEKTLITKDLHGNDFYHAFDDAFGLLYFELKQLSGAML